MKVISVLHNAYDTWSLDWHPQGTLLASGGRAGVVRVWAPDQPKPIDQFQVNCRAALQWSPDSNKLLADNAYDAAIIDTQNGSIQHIPFSDGSSVDSLCWGMQGHVWVGTTNYLYVFGSHGQVIARIHSGWGQAYPMGVADLALRPCKSDSEEIIAIALRHSIKVCQLVDQDVIPLWDFSAESDIISLSWTRDGDQLGILTQRGVIIGVKVKVHEKEPSSSPVRLNRSKLLQVLTTHYDEDELRTLCFEMWVDYDDLAGQKKTGKARELIAYLERVGRISELVKLGSEQRSHISWQGIFETTTADSLVAEVTPQRIHAILTGNEIFRWQARGDNAWQSSQKHIAWSSDGKYLACTPPLGGELYVFGSTGRIDTPALNAMVVAWHPELPILAAGGLETRTFDPYLEQTTSDEESQIVLLDFS